MNIMVRLLCLFGLGLAAVLFAVPVRAGSCATTYYPSYSTYVAPTVVNEIKVEKRYVFELVPLYAVGLAPAYVPPPVAPAAPAAASTMTPCEETAKRLEARLAAMEAALKAQGPTFSTAPPAAEQPPRMPAVGGREDAVRAGIAVLSARCATCHTGATSKKDANGLPVALFTEPGKLSAEIDAVAIMLATEGDHMPPGKPLSAVEKKTVRDMVRAASVAKK